MKWELIGNDIVVLEGCKFAIGAKWLPAIHEISGISRKFKANNLLISSSTTQGCIVEKNSFAQIASCNDASVGETLLAANLFGAKNTLFFARVTDELFWVVSFDGNGCIDVVDDSDSLKEFYPLRDYIREVVELSDSGESYKIINLGDKVYLDDIHLDPRIEHKPISTLEIETFSKSAYKVRSQAGNLKKKIYFSGFAAICGAGLLLNFLLTSIPQEVTDISEGQHSHAFTTKYSKLKSEFNKIVSEDKKSQKMSSSKVYEIGMTEFNDYVLSRGITNSDILNKILEIRKTTPFYLLGWKRSTIEYRDDKFVVSYTRQDEFPLSSNYTDLDSALIAKLKDNHNTVLVATNLSQRGDVRQFEVIVGRTQNSSYSDFLIRKRDVSILKQTSMSKIRSLQQQLDGAKREIEDVESSVNDLGVFHRRDSDALGFIIGKIDEITSLNSKKLREMESALKQYSEIKDEVSPNNSEFLLEERGIESKLFPIFQSSSLYKWSNPVSSHKFPISISEDKFKEMVVIRGSTIRIVIANDVFGIWSISDVIKQPYVFIDNVSVKEDRGESVVTIDISTNELNQDFIF